MHASQAPHHVFHTPYPPAHASPPISHTKKPCTPSPQYGAALSIPAKLPFLPPTKPYAAPNFDFNCAIATRARERSEPLARSSDWLQAAKAACTHQLASSTQPRLQRTGVARGKALKLGSALSGANTAAKAVEGGAERGPAF